MKINLIKMNSPVLSLTAHFHISASLSGNTLCQSERTAHAPVVKGGAAGKAAFLVVC